MNAAQPKEFNKTAFVKAVQDAIARLLPEMPRNKVIAASLKARGALVLTRDLEEACAVANRIAPEHLELVVDNPEAWLPKLTRAGAVFLGRWSSEAIGDYCAWPNHVLPTAGSARFFSPLGVYDFVKRTDREFTLVVGDAAGHGVPAALVLAGVQARFRVEAAGVRVLVLR